MTSDTQELKVENIVVEVGDILVFKARGQKPYSVTVTEDLKQRGYVCVPAVSTLNQTYTSSLMVQSCQLMKR